MVLYINISAPGVSELLCEKLLVIAVIQFRKLVNSILDVIFLLFLLLCLLFLRRDHTI